MPGPLRSAVTNTSPVSRAGDLDVVDVAAQNPVAIDQLAIEEIERRVQDAGRLGHDPPLVMIISGMVATATTTSTTRYTEAMPFAKRPLV
ncbi:MAG: hypothetical protein JWM34_1590 [Ilumatobacteraceae bacterium]|nr:hypothetical protein [Ilumatobacteraceae bacterium]